MLFRSGDGDFDEIHSFGGRSFSIHSAATGDLVFDSGDAFEQISKAAHEAGVVIFNASNDNNTFDGRSRAKGPEPCSTATLSQDLVQVARLCIPNPA